MAKNLVVVESPAKAKTINKYLGKDFVVMASIGRIKDLPSRGLGVRLSGILSGNWLGKQPSVIEWTSVRDRM